ncbi:MAG: AI-2E family transporter [Planctomycetota bacterium]|nr:MAG: AI-2E family transporter [Planctomycetota bacterium]
MARIVSLSVLSTLIVVLGLTFFRVLAPFVMPLFLAGVTAILIQPLFQKLVRRCHGRVSLAAGIMTSGLMGAILVPATIAILLASLELYTLSHTVGNEDFLRKAGDSVRVKSDDLIIRSVTFANGFLPEHRRTDPAKAIELVRDRLRDSINGLGDRSLGMLTSSDSLGVLGTTVGTTVDIIGKLLSTTVSVMLGLTIFMVALYYFLAEGPELIVATEALIPVHLEYQRTLLDAFSKSVRSVVLATFAAAIAQGVATTLALQLCGFGNLFALLLLSTIFSLIPLAGAWIVWGPFAIGLFASGHWVQGTILTLYGVVIIGMLDNVVRAYVLNSDTKLHPLLAFVSVLGGIQALGLWGVFIGPIVASCLYALVTIFNTELFALSREKFSLEASPPTASEVAVVPPPAPLKESSQEPASAHMTQEPS